MLNIPNVSSSNHLVKGVANDWQISGITQFQSGVNLQAVGSTNFNLGGYLPAGTKLPDGTVLPSGIGISNALITGSPDIATQPTILCDPSQNLQKNQFVNGACFGLPSPGHNGSFILDKLDGPAYFNSDISAFKNFQMSESKKLQFRFSAYNFLNHPITTFLPGDQNLNLSFNQAGQLTNPNFGKANYKIGHRSIQLALKFYF